VELSIVSPVVVPSEGVGSVVDPSVGVGSVVDPSVGVGSVVAWSVVESLGAVGSVEVEPSGVDATDALSPVGSVDVEVSDVVGVEVDSVGAVEVVGSPLGGAPVTVVCEGGGWELLGAGAV